MKEMVLSQGEIALVDDADYEYLNQFKWYASRDSRTGKLYARYNLPLSNGRRNGIGMHRFVLGLDNPRIEGDHIDGNGLNNQRGNLRPATRSQNQMNRPSLSNNTSGYKGVDFHKASGKWRARIASDGKPIHLGIYATAEEAAVVYDAAARELHGEFARCNFSLEEMLP